MGLRDWLKKKAKKAKKAAEKAGEAIEDTATDAGHAIKKTADDLAREAEELARKADDKTRGEIMSILDDAKELAGKAKREVTDLASKAKQEITDTASSAKREIEGVGKKVEDGITKDLPDLLIKVMSALADEAIKPVLRAAARELRETHAEMENFQKSDAELVSEINSVGFTVLLKLNLELKLIYQESYERMLAVAGILDRYANDGIALRRRDIIGFITAVAPTFVDYGVGAEFSVALEIGGKISLNRVPTKLFTLLADKILARAGVPE